jgi:hypothetical protein
MTARERKELIQELYRCNEQLMTYNEVLRELGQHDCAAHVREAACDIVRAIARLVKSRADEDTQAVEVQS